MVVLLRPHWVSPAMVPPGKDMERDLAAQEATTEAVHGLENKLLRVCTLLQIGLDVDLDIEEESHVV